jgi:hypothetical protein
MTTDREKAMQIAIDFNAAYPPHQRHSDTSRASAALTAPKFNARTLDLLKEFRNQPQGMTDEFGQGHLKIEGNSYRLMRVTLYKHGYVEDSGDRQKLKSGRFGAVWRITGFGLDKLREEGL